MIKDQETMDPSTLFDDTPIWRIYKQVDGQVGPVLDAWYSGLDESRFLTKRTFGTKREAVEWLQEFWQAYWQLAR
jgi:hypothetical protein